MRTGHRYGRSTGLTLRMAFVMLLLVLVYLAFVTVLFALRVNIVFIAVFVAGTALVQYFFSDKLVLASMGAHDVSPEQAPELHGLIDRLCQLIDLPKPRVAIADLDVPNAFATGRNPKHAVVCCTTGIMRRLDTNELEAVLAHELSHVKNRDVAIITWASIFSTIASFIVQWGFWLGLGGGGGRRDRNNNGGAVILIYFASVVVWIASFFLIRALSRYRELAADRGSAIITGAPSHLMSALVKISGTIARIPTQDLRRVESQNAFMIVPAINGNSLAGLFSTHPSLETRLEQLRQLQRQMEGT
ncbi:MAG: zinc metalloprotease HtpX [Dehalococcoidia bacterium]